MTLGEKIRTTRKNLRMSRDILAKQVGVSKKTLYNYETDQTSPQTMETFQKIADVLGLDVKELFISSPKKEELEILAFKSNIEAFFSGENLREDDMDEVMLAVQEAYTIAKRKIRKEREESDNS